MHLLDNLASLHMLLCDMQKFKPILQSNVIINILASKLLPEFKRMLYPVLIFRSVRATHLCVRACRIKPVFHQANLFARREAKTRIRQRGWLKLAGEKIRREQVGSVPTFLSVRAIRANKFA